MSQAPPPATPAPAVQPAPGPKGLKGYVKRYWKELLALVLSAAGLILFVLWRSGSSSSSGSGTTDEISYPSSSGGGEAAGSSAASTAASDLASGLDPSGWTQFGPGFETPDNAPVTENGYQYTWVPSQAAAQALVDDGQTLYFAVAPGIFAPSTSADAGAALYTQTPIPAGYSDANGPEVTSGTSSEEVYSGL